MSLSVAGSFWPVSERLICAGESEVWRAGPGGGGGIHGVFDSTICTYTAPKFGVRASM